MKLMFLAAAAAVALSAAGCASLPPPADYHVQATRAMVAAEGAFNAAAKAQLAVCGRPVPLMPRSARCIQGDGLRHTAYDALKVARAAYNRGAMPDTGALVQVATQLGALFTKEP